MQRFISKGRNIEEAINLGLKVMGVEREGVEIEVVQMGSKGFIGIGRKPAIVKLSLNQNSHEDQELSTSNDQNRDGDLSIEEAIDHMSFEDGLEDDGSINKQDDLLGKVWVDNGQVFVKDSSTKYPAVTIGEGIKLIKNNEEIKEKSTILTEKDQVDIQIEGDIQKETTDWKVHLEDQELRAVLEVNPGYEIHRNLKDIEPDEHIELSIEEMKEVINTLSYEEVIEELDLLRIAYGINYNEIIQATTVTEPSQFTVAKGLKPQSGENGWVEYKVDINPQNGLVEGEDGKVDFRESKLIPTVEKGEFIAVIHPPKPGIPGVTVTNEPLPAPQTFPIKLSTGKGIAEVDQQLVATESGRPSIEQRGQLVKAAIVPKLLHRGNVNLSSGNIRFNGDVEIIGEVEENMLVEADGEIFVHKSTSYASLTTSNSIVVKGNVVSSELEAGKSNMLMVELGHLLEKMHQQIDQMITFIKQLSQSQAFKSNGFSMTDLQPLITIILEKRFKGFASHAKEYQEAIQSEGEFLSEEWGQVANELKHIFLTLSNQRITMDRLINLSKKMKELAEFSQIPTDHNTYISIAEADNSSLYCSGDINIIGKGSINSKVHTDGHLHVRGLVRGGEVYGRLGVKIREVGSNSGAKTVVSVPGDQIIKINRALEGTVLKIGNAKYTLYEERKHVMAKLNESEEIIFV
ncbi:hypothetical protein TMU01_12810 [Tenuibacillus multivorans]|nr:hypothetical protein TMU01_12810 [Tenuibacillus multivorans]